ncbi:MAG: hypothetical protein KGJ40_01205 [candidate division NC10 bacterium]|nr:hypothetical protein [candidate division NC10 bacterium]
MAVAIRNSSLWLTLLGLSLLSFGCATAPMLTPPAVIVPTPALKGVRVAVVDFVPLPKIYPTGLRPLFPSLTGELYEEERVVTGPEVRTSSGEETVTIRTFVPRDHWAILTDTILLAMKEKGMIVEQAPSIAAAKQQGAVIIIAGVVKEFEVTGQATYRFARFDWFQFRPTDLASAGEANVRVWMIIFSGLTGDRLREEELHATATHTALPTNAFYAKGARVLEIDEASLHPLRALLTVASYNLAAQLVDRLGQTVALSGGPRR